MRLFFWVVLRGAFWNLKCVLYVSRLRSGVGYLGGLPPFNGSMFTGIG